jgi:uncharacterized membrane protein
MPLQILLLLHLLGVIVWVGGMFFAYFCLRPAAVQVLEPPLRLRLWAATFDPFLKFTAAAVAVIILTGLAMVLHVGFRLAPVGWHVMLSLGFVMASVFGYVYGVLYPRLRSQCTASTWAAAAATLNAIRRLVAINLLLSLGAIAAAAFSR